MRTRSRHVASSYICKHAHSKNGTRSKLPMLDALAVLAESFLDMHACVLYHTTCTAR